MDLGLTDDIKTVPDLRHRIRQLRWFKASFRHDVGLISRRYGLSFTIDDRRLTEAYLNWAEAFARNRHYAGLDRRDFVTFAAGLLLRELIATQPVTAEEVNEVAETAVVLDGASRIARSWPEGFLYTNYCLCILAAVLDQEGMTLTLPALADDLRTWWSYRENTGQDPAAAIAFLDLFTGIEPNWFMPDSVASRRAMKRAIAARVLPGGSTPDQGTLQSLSS